MKKILVCLIGLMLLTSLAFAGTIGPITFDNTSTADVVTPGVVNTTFSIASGSIVYSRSFDLESAEYMAVSYKLTPISGVPNITIVMEQSYAHPTIEGAYDSLWDVPYGGATVDTALSNSLIHHKAINPIALPYARYKITEGGSATSTLIMKTSLEKNR